MSNETQKLEETVNDSSLTLGQYLAQARQASGLSVVEVAQRTNRPASYLQAIEADDYSAFTSPAMIRGIVSQYAKVVGADHAQAMSLLPSNLKPNSNLTSVGLKEGQDVIQQQSALISRSKLSKAGLVLLSLVVLALLVYWVFGARFFKKQDEPKKLTPANQVQITTTPAQPTPAVPSADTNAANASQASTNVATENTSAPAAGNNLGLKFRAPVWIEIKDAQGKVLLSGIQQTGTEQNISGETPLSVKLGDGTNVDMSWKGQPYDLSPMLKDGNTVIRIKDLQ